jgi:iron complex outermembrane receptor protein
MIRSRPHLLLAFFLLGPFVATEAAEEAAAQKSKRVIEEVIVTATKREESSREIAASVSAISGASLEDTGVQSSTQFLEMVPGVTQVDDGSNNRRITVRGVAAPLAVNPTTGFFYGDTVFSDPFLPRVLADPNPFDMASIEVLKGPQGTLFGGSAFNGAIRYLPQKPLLDEWQVKYFAQHESVKYGETGLIYGAAINVPIGEDLAVRITAHDRDSAGWIDELNRGEQDVNGVEQDSVRAQLLWQATDRLGFLLSYVHQESLFKDLGFADASPEKRLERDSTPIASPQEAEYTLTSLKIDYQFDAFDIALIAGRNEKSLDVPKSDLSRQYVGSDDTAPAVAAKIMNETIAKTMELRFTSNGESGSQWKWIGGAFQYESDYDDSVDIVFAPDIVLPIDPSLLAGVDGSEGFVTADGNINGVLYAPTIFLEEQAIYGELTRTFWNQLDVTLGLRVFQYETNGVIYMSGALAQPFVLRENDGDTVVRRYNELDDSGVSGKLSVFHTVSDNWSWFATYSQGFRYAGIQISPPSAIHDVPPTYKSDEIDSYEVGVRTSWFENSLILDLTAYYLDWIDPQVVQVDPQTKTFSFVENLGGAENQGLELAFGWLPPIDGLSITASVATSDMKVTKPFTTAAGTEVQKGDDWFLSPDMQSALSVSYRRNIGGLELGIALDHVYSSKAQMDFDTGTDVFDYETYGLRADVAWPTLSWLPKLSVSLDNLKDTRGLVGAGPVQTIDDRIYIRPRTLSVRLSGEF